MSYIDPKEIERVKQIDLLTYLRNNDPDELIKCSAREYSTKTHDSLKISGGYWHWFSRGIGGRSALNYLIKVKGMSFLDAVHELLKVDRTPACSLPTEAARVRPTVARFLLPPRHTMSNKVKGYLMLRGIDPYVITECIKSGLIYETHTNHMASAVFVGRDSGGKPRYAFQRGCGGDFKNEVTGSDKRFSFRLRSNNGNPTVHIFESCIDALSFASLTLADDRDWRHENLLSLGGVQVRSTQDGDSLRIPRALTQWIKDEPHTREVILHLDNDPAGLAAADAIATSLQGRFECSIAPPPIGKDMNDYLLIKNRKRGIRNLAR